MSVFTKFYEAPKFNKTEILRYAGTKEASEQTSELLESCLNECSGVFSYKVCFSEERLIISDGTITAGSIKTDSKALLKNLDGCEKAVIFAATVGIGIDRLIFKYSSVSPSRALMFQAIGAERIESLCDMFSAEICEKYAAEGLYITARFSPGYGDFSVRAQKDFFKILDCPRKIGLSLNDSFIMSPTKSVTAVIGISEKAQKKANPCENCTLDGCAYKNRKQGETK